MSKFRKKPVVIEAMQFTIETKNQVFNWITCNHYADWDKDDPAIKIETLEGDMIARLGDWVIKGTSGEFYPCKPDIFAEIYMAVDDAAESDLLQRALAALESVMKKVDDGTLVRETGDDAKPGWALRQLPLVMALQKADAVLREAGRR